MASTRPELDALRRAVDSAVESNPEAGTRFVAAKAALKVAQSIRQLRAAEGLSQDELARRMGVSQPFIARLESGTSDKKPSFETLAKVARAFGRELSIHFVEPAAAGETTEGLFEPIDLGDNPGLLEAQSAVVVGKRTRGYIRRHPDQQYFVVGSDAKGVVHIPDSVSIERKSET